MWQNALLQGKVLLLSSLCVMPRRRNWLYRILKIWNEKGKCYLKFFFLLLHVCTPTQEVKPPQARMPKVRQSTPDYLCILPLLWQMSSKVEVLASCSLIRRLKFHLCVVMLLDSRLSRNHSEISKNCSLEHSIYNFVQLFGAMPLTSSVHASVTNSVELENEDSNE